MIRETQGKKNNKEQLKNISKNQGNCMPDWKRRAHERPKKINENTSIQKHSILNFRMMGVSRLF